MISIPDKEHERLLLESAQLRDLERRYVSALVSLRWAMSQLGTEPRLIRGQNDAYCAGWAAAKVALAGESHG